MGPRPQSSMTAPRRPSAGTSPRAVQLNAEAVAFAGHYGFDIDVLAANRPTGKGRVERYDDITRAHVPAGRTFRSIGQGDAAFLTWLPIRPAQVHRTYGQVIGERAVIDRTALRPLPAMAYVVAEVHVRRVGKDYLLSFEGSHYSVRARMVRAGQRIEVRPTASSVTIRALPADGGHLLATHRRASRSGSWIVKESHWDGLTDGHTRAVTTIVAGPAHAAGTDPRICRRTWPAAWRSRSACARWSRTRPRPAWRRTDERAHQHPHPGGRRSARPDPPAGSRRRPGHPRRDRPARLLGLPGPRPRGGCRPARAAPLPQRPQAVRPAAPQDPRRVRLRVPVRPRTPQDQRPRHLGVHIYARSNFALLGPPGVGKIHIAVALAVAACQAGHSNYFTSLDDLVRKLKIAEATGRFNKQLDAFVRPAVLLVDEVGYLRLEREEANMFFQLISRRYERGSMIITSNKSFSNGAPSSATTSSPLRSSTGSCTTSKSCPSTDPATACATGWTSSPAPT